MGKVTDRTRGFFLCVCVLQEIADSKSFIHSTKVFIQLFSIERYLPLARNQINSDNLQLISTLWRLMLSLTLFFEVFLFFTVREQQYCKRVSEMHLLSGLAERKNMFSLPNDFDNNGLSGSLQFQQSSKLKDNYDCPHPHEQQSHHRWELSAVAAAREGGRSPSPIAHSLGSCQLPVHWEMSVALPATLHAWFQA